MQPWVRPGHSTTRTSTRNYQLARGPRPHSKPYRLTFSHQRSVNHVGSTRAYEVGALFGSRAMSCIDQNRLARIIGRILRTLYSIQPVSERCRAAAVKTISKDLSEWRAELAWFLDSHLFSTSLFMLIFQHKGNDLNLTCWQAVILTHRPFVLATSVGSRDKVTLLRCMEIHRPRV